MAQLSHVPGRFFLTCMASTMELPLLNVYQFGNGGSLSYRNKCWPRRLLIHCYNCCRGRGRGGPGAMRFDPYTMSSNGGRRPFPGPDSYASAAYGYSPIDPYERASFMAPRRPMPSVGSEGFARDLLELYHKNPVAFDSYARDPLVRQSLNLTGTESQEDSYYRPPQDYYDQKMNSRYVFGIQQIFLLL